ncbi:hypothetical protein [Delftia sp. JD2]|uniref:hypothetical protein n=1 Tax=Delftia sp. JD2 TaxID=469553 RepID=UPI000806A2F4|nr:hypothetical protein [Delftia sp. JD2]OBY87008.1 hypothetical protein ACM14_02425 [Delftia sp. JD2]
MTSAFNKIKPVDTGATSVEKVAMSQSAQKLLAEAGYEPKADWVYIEDLVQKYLHRHKGKDALLEHVKSLLADSVRPVTRSEFVRLTAELDKREAEQEKNQARADQLSDILTKAGVTEVALGHEALAIRIYELERAVEAYAQKLKIAESSAPRGPASGAMPFLAGVMIGGLLF